MPCSISAQRQTGRRSVKTITSCMIWFCRFLIRIIVVESHSISSPHPHQATKNHCVMSMEGLIPFVCGAIKKRRAAKQAVDYERLSSAGAPPTWGHERFPGGAYDHPPRSQSCRFAARLSGDERGLSRGDGARALPEGLRDEPSPTTPPVGDGWRGLSKSRRFSSMRLFGCVSGA